MDLSRDICYEKNQTIPAEDNGRLDRWFLILEGLRYVKCDEVISKFSEYRGRTVIAKQRLLSLQELPKEYL